jgi:hypothetical protein
VSRTRLSPRQIESPVNQSSKSRISLNLRRSTVRNLTTPELGAAHGGIIGLPGGGTVTTVTTVTTVNRGISVANLCNSNMSGCTLVSKVPLESCIHE